MKMSKAKREKARMASAAAKLQIVAICDHWRGRGKRAVVQEVIPNQYRMALENLHGCAVTAKAHDVAKQIREFLTGKRPTFEYGSQVYVNASKIDPSEALFLEACRIDDELYFDEYRGPGIIESRVQV